MPNRSQRKFFILVKPVPDLTQMIYLAACVLDGSTPPDSVDEVIQKLPESWVPSIDRYLRKDDRIKSLIGRLLLIEILTKTGCDKDLLPAWLLSHGRPSFPGVDFDFSISHTEGLVVCALNTSGRVGVDVERIRGELDFTSFQSVMSEEQWKTIRSSAFPEKEFFKAWTYKESLTKAEGRGVYIPFEKIETTYPFSSVEDKKWYCLPINPTEEHTGHICSNYSFATEDVEVLAYSESGLIRLPS